jgi:hypothetical protein
MVAYAVKTGMMFVIEVCNFQFLGFVWWKYLFFLY